MKNLYILPTDKPSRLIMYSTLVNELRLTQDIVDWKHYRHVYITSDEEILEGDWHLKTSNNTIANYHLNSINPNKGRYKKIIITTDQDLINDGVQSINEEFLQWLIKHPKCDDVRVDNNRYLNIDTQKLVNSYAIIIPEKDKWKALENSNLDTPLRTWDNEEETKKLYSEIEHLIITWELDGTKTAGSLTREIMSLIKKTK